MRVECDKCGHAWEYKGASKCYVTCPSCLSKVDIRSDSKEMDIEND